MQIQKMLILAFLLIALLIDVLPIVAQQPKQQHIYLPIVINTDADADGMPDDWELRYGLNPNDVNDADYDLDSDLLVNASEFTRNTLPNNFDTDGDLLPDGYEVNSGLDPVTTDALNTDPDNDTLTNLRELIYSTLPLNPDTDGDGVSDGVEVDQGSDPSNSFDDGHASPATDLVNIRLTVGDHSQSHSERYNLIVGPVTHQAPEFGVVATAIYQFQRGETYPITIVHNGSCPNQCWPDLPDYDYTALVQPISSTVAIQIDDPERILGVHGESNFFYAAGKAAYLTVPGICQSPTASSINTECLAEVSDGEKVLTGTGSDPSNFAYINEQAEMPPLAARILTENLPPEEVQGDVEWKLVINYTRDGRNDSSQYMITLPIASTWDIRSSMQDQLRGGEAVLLYKFGKHRGKFSFHIRARQPDDNDVLNYIQQQSPPWYARYIAKHETINQNGTRTFFNQFKESHTIDLNGVPLANQSADGGMGIFQLTNLPKGFDRSPNGKPSSQQLWSWKANVDAGLQLMAMHRSQANRWMNSITGKIGQRIQAQNDVTVCNQLNPIPKDCPKQVPVIPDIDYGATCQFRDNTSASQTFEDAVAIKLFNGGSSGNFVSWINDEWRWELNELNSLNFNYVKRTCEDWDK